MARMTSTEKTLAMRELESAQNFAQQHGLIAPIVDEGGGIHTLTIWWNGNRLVTVQYRLNGLCQSTFYAADGSVRNVGTGSPLGMVQQALAQLDRP